MSKISLKVLLKEKNNILINEKYNGIISDNIIKYQDKETKNIFNLNEETLKRINKDYEINLNFKEKNGIYKLNNLELLIQLKIIKKERKNNNYSICYELFIEKENIGLFNYEINYEVIT